MPAPAGQHSLRKHIPSPHDSSTLRLNELSSGQRLQNMQGVTATGATTRRAVRLQGQRLAYALTALTKEPIFCLTLPNVGWPSSGQLTFALNLQPH